MLQITPTDRVVLQLLADGAGDEELRSLLRLTTPEVDEHLGNLYARLGVPSRLEAVAAAMKRGLLAVDQLVRDQP